MSEPAIRAIELEKRYGAVHAVRGVSFEVRPTEIFGFLGRNGSGKTTTVRMLTTLTRPTSGDAYVAGVDVVRDPAGVRARVGVTMQEAAGSEDDRGRAPSIRRSPVGLLQGARCSTQRPASRALRARRRLLSTDGDVLRRHAASPRHRNVASRRAADPVPR